MHSYSHSPISPYGVEHRSYNTPSSKKNSRKRTPNSGSFSLKFTDERKKKMLKGLLIAFFVLVCFFAIFLSYITSHDFTQEEMNDENWMRFEKLISWSKTNTGKLVTLSTWVVGVVGVVMSIQYYNKHH